jgi:hypothetical protein
MRPSTYKIRSHCASSIPDARLCRLAEQIHSLGPYPLAHLFAELVDGAPLEPRLEVYARLAPLGFFICAHNGDKLPGLRIAAGTASI